MNFPCIDVVADGVNISINIWFISCICWIDRQTINVIKLPLGITIFPDIVPPASCKYRASKEPKFGEISNHWFVGVVLYINVNPLFDGVGSPETTYISPFTNGGPTGGRAAKVPVVTVPRVTVTFPDKSGKIPLTDWTAPFTFETGILVTAVKDAVPFPTTYPVKVEFPVPPFDTPKTTVPLIVPLKVGLKTLVQRLMMFLTLKVMFPK